MGTFKRENQCKANYHRQTFYRHFLLFDRITDKKSKPLSHSGTYLSSVQIVDSLEVIFFYL